MLRLNYLIVAEQESLINVPYLNTSGSVGFIDRLEIINGFVTII